MGDENCANSRGKDVEINVNNSFLMKHIKDDPNNENTVLIMGTFIQIADFRALNITDGDNYFNYKINQEDASENNYVKMRRNECLGNNIYKTTFDVKAPMEISEEVFNSFPFVIVKATISVDLSTIIPKNLENQIRLRPELNVNKDRTINFSIQCPDNITEKKFSDWANGNEGKKNSTHELLDKKMDRCVKYDFVTFAPEINYILKMKNYEESTGTNENSCDKFKVSFYLKEQGTTKFVKIVPAMVLIAVMNLFHVLENGSSEKDYLSNSATFALTVVFLLGDMIPRSRKDSTSNMNTLYIFIIFFGLMLSCFPANTVGTPIVSYVGAALFGFSFFIPINNYFSYCSELRILEKTHKIKDFVMDEKKKFNEKQHEFHEYFEPISTILANKEKMSQFGFAKKEKSERIYIYKGFHCCDKNTKEYQDNGDGGV